MTYCKSRIWCSAQLNLPHTTHTLIFLSSFLFTPPLHLSLFLLHRTLSINAGGFFLNGKSVVICLWWSFCVTWGKISLQENSKSYVLCPIKLFLTSGSDCKMSAKTNSTRHDNLSFYPVLFVKVGNKWLLESQRRWNTAYLLQTLCRACKAAKYDCCPLIQVTAAPNLTVTIWKC